MPLFSSFFHFISYFTAWSITSFVFSFLITSLFIANWIPLARNFQMPTELKYRVPSFICLNVQCNTFWIYVNRLINRTSKRFHNTEWQYLTVRQQCRRKLSRTKRLVVIVVRTLCGKTKVTVKNPICEL